MTTWKLSVPSLCPPRNFRNSPVWKFPSTRQLGTCFGDSFHVRLLLWWLWNPSYKDVRVRRNRSTSKLRCQVWGIKLVPGICPPVSAEGLPKWMSGTRVSRVGVDPVHTGLLLLMGCGQQPGTKCSRPGYVCQQSRSFFSGWCFDLCKFVSLTGVGALDRDSGAHCRRRHFNDSSETCMLPDWHVG
jgi:hypothetical protein